MEKKKAFILSSSTFWNDLGVAWLALKKKKRVKPPLPPKKQKNKNKTTTTTAFRCFLPALVTMLRDCNKLRDMRNQESGAGYDCMSVRYRWRLFDN